MCYNSPHRLCYISLPRQLLNILVNYNKMNKGDLTKLCLPRRLIIKLMQKGKSLVTINAKNIFQILQKIQNLIFTVKISFFCGCTSIITHFLYNLEMEWWFIKRYSYIMSNKAEPFNLIQIFPLLQLTLVTFTPVSPTIFTSLHMFENLCKGRKLL